MSDKNKHDITSWDDLMSCLHPTEPDDDLNRFRRLVAYRGMPKDFALLNSFTRSINPNLPDETKRALEDQILRTFRQYSQDATVEHDSLWNWIAVAQHHGLPTRLLDWTWSPLVALHFAMTDLDKHKDDAAVIWLAYIQPINEYLPDHFKEKLEDNKAGRFTVDILDQIQLVTATREAKQRNVRFIDMLNAFDDNSDEAPFVVFFEPPALDMRMVNQFALFSVMSDSLASLNTWFEARPETYFKIVIPPKFKWEIRDKLDMNNITERVLFPGLDGLAKWLKRYYGPGPNR